MKIKHLIILLVLMGVTLIPLSLSSNTEIERWTFGPWQTQSMISWGDDLLIVDFGENGLWSYDGEWIRLSHLNPKSMVTWGDSFLVVDFGSHGLWKYDRSTWEQIAL